MVYLFAGGLRSTVDPYVLSLFGGALLHRLVCPFPSLDGCHC